MHTDLLFLANKEQTFWPRETIDAMLHKAQMWKFGECLRRYAVDQEAQDDLSPFKEEHVFSSLVSGLLNFDNEKYARLLGLWVQYTEGARVRYSEIEIINEAQLAKRLNSQLNVVSLTSPIGTIPSFGKVQLYPKASYAGYGYYIKTPTPPKMAYTYTEERTFSYNQSNSEQLLWNETCVTHIIMKALQLLGVNIESDRLIMYTENKDQQKP